MGRIKTHEERSRKIMKRTESRKAFLETLVKKVASGQATKVEMMTYLTIPKVNRAFWRKKRHTFESNRGAK